jgi:hypothetical protein
MNSAVRLNHVRRRLLVMIVYVYRRINHGVTRGLNVAMAMHSVQIVRMKGSVRIGGAIRIMERFFVKI